MPTAIADTQLGLPPSELALLRHHHTLALNGGRPAIPSSHGGGGYASSTSSRGRGTHRSTPSSSRAASAASSASTGQRLMLDAGSLSVLGAYFDRLMHRIQERVEYLSSQTSSATMARSRGAARTVAGADEEIRRFKEVLRQIDELETEFDKVRHIRDIVKGMRGRVESVGRGLRR